MSSVIAGLERSLDLPDEQQQNSESLRLFAVRIVISVSNGTQGQYQTGYFVSRAGAQHIRAIAHSEMIHSKR
jgi:hypothetical protein